MAIKVMLMDDSKFMRELIKDELTKYGVSEVAESESKSEAMNIFRVFKPDLVFLDIVMEDSGLEVLKELKEIKQDSKIYMLSSIAQKDVTDYALKLGAEGLIEKPDYKEDIRKIMEEFANER